MHKVVIDNNIIISASMNQGTCAKVVDFALDYYQIFISEEVLDEYNVTIQKKKFDHIRENFNKILHNVLTVSEKIDIKNITSPALPDKTDEIYVRTALAAKAKYLITGNIKHYPRKTYEETEIVTPRAFLDIHSESF